MVTIFTPERIQSVLNEFPINLSECSNVCLLIDLLWQPLMSISPKDKFQSLAHLGIEGRIELDVRMELFSSISEGLKI